MDKLNILWTTDNKINVKYFLSMYSVNSLKSNWWDSVRVIIWGGSNLLIKEDKEVQDLIKDMIKNNVVVEACLKCSDELGTTSLLKDLGIDVKYMGSYLTKYLKDEKVISL